MSLRKVNAALVNAYQLAGAGIPTAYEVGAEFTPPANALWVYVHNMPASLRPVTLGPNGEDSYNGVFSINIYVPRNTGTKVLLDTSWQFLTAFQAGVRIYYQSQEVRIRRSEVSPIRSAEEFADNAITVSVYWEARFIRNLAVAIPQPGQTSSGYGFAAQLDFEFIQETASTQWVINHNLGRKVTTDIYSTGGMKVLAGVVNVSNNQTIVNFDTAQAGYAIIN